MLILALPATKKFHSSEVGCQWISRIAPGLTVTTAAEKRLAIGNVVGSRILTLPPTALCVGACLERWYVYEFCRETIPAEPVIFCSAISAGAGVPGKMKSSPAGILSHAERGTWKFLESTSSYVGVRMREIPSEGILTGL